MSDKTEISDKFKTPNKFEKFLASRNIILNCLIPGKNVNGIFSVPIFNTNKNQVSSLADEIKNCCLDRFKDNDSSRLKLYKNKANADSVIIYNLKNNNIVILDSIELINSENTICSYFNNQSEPFYSGKKVINVIIYPPTDN